MTASASRPRFSIVTAVHDVEAYLPAFIQSVERQGLPPGALEVVAVDDGSTDGSLDLLLGWAGRSRLPVRVFTQPNAGQGSARNLGLEHATGRWVTFTDPDDLLDRGFLGAAERFARAHPAVALLASRPLLLFDADGSVRDRHPRRRQFAHGSRVVDLEDEPNVFSGSSTVSLFQLDRLRETGLRFDPRVRPNFEDGHFAVRYLLELPRPVVGLVRDARYLYRKRGTGTSTLARSLRDPDRYTTVLEHGYLDVIRRARAALGRVPAWLQQVLVYELYWYLNEERKLSTDAVIPDAVQSRFHELFAEIASHLDPEVVAGHAVIDLDPVLVDVLARAGGRRPWHGSYVVRTRVDQVMDLQRLEYRFSGPAPAETALIAGAPVPIASAKTMGLRFYGRNLLSQRVVWVPAGVDGFQLDGLEIPVLSRWPKARRLGTPAERRGRLRRRLGRIAETRGRTILPALRARARRARVRATGWTLRRLAAMPPYRRRYARAWLVMDRIHDADDNGERLFEHLRARRPDINAWFVLESGVADWRRLVETGEARLLAHGSLAWRLAMLNADWLLSSHADVPIYRPPALGGTGPATWRFGFLQHGVIKDDLSLWLNRRELELFVVSTADELASVAGDGSAYRFGTKETANTGLPRFDRLLAQASAVAPEDRTLVIVGPTWRQWLNRPLARGSQRRELEGAFWDSEYVRAWTGLLRSERVAAAIERRGWRLAFMPHPNLQASLADLELPPHVEALSFAGTDVQALYARCALLVTDYSSVAFNMAYLDRPVVYYQFDREQVLGGAHVGRRGYYDYERDGFGPVTTDLEATEEAVVAAIDHGGAVEPSYADRIAAAFPSRDGRCCERVVAAVEARSRAWRPASEP